VSRINFESTLGFNRALQVLRLKPLTILQAFRRSCSYEPPNCINRPLISTFLSYTSFHVKATMGNRPRNLLKRLSMFLVYLFVAYVLFLIAVRLFESRFIFFPNYPSRLEGDWHPRTLSPEDVWITASDGTKLHAWWIFNPDAKFSFLAFHGNASVQTEKSHLSRHGSPMYSRPGLAF